MFRLSFRYDQTLVERARALPFAHFDGETKTWTCLVCSQSLDALRGWYYDGLTDLSVDRLLEPGEQPEPCQDAILRPGSLRRPFMVHPAQRDDILFARLRAIPGSAWEREAGAMSYGPMSAPALGELVDRGVLDDPANLLSPAAVSVGFDTRVGKFSVRGDDRAAASFTQHFPERDVMEIWRERGLDVAFADSFSEEIYRGELARVKEPPAIDGMLIPLYDYQARSVAIALERSGLLVADAPGLGKTPLAIATGVELLNRQAVTRVVVIVPGAIRTQWRREIERFCGHQDIVVVEGDRKKRLAAYAAGQTARWVVVHYDVLHKDFKDLTPLVSGSLLIADEAHRLKNNQAKRTQAARKLANRAARRLALTGTPVMNSPDELYGVLGGFTVPGCLGTAGDFLGRYMYRNRFGGYSGARNLAELHQRANIFWVRHTKEEVATHLPPMRIQHLSLDPEPAYAAALRRAHREAREEIAVAAKARVSRKGNGVLDGQLLDDAEAGAEMTAVGMLRLMCSSPRLVLSSDSEAGEALRNAGIVPDADGSKLDELRLMVQERQAAGERVVVFSSSRRMVDLISTRFDEDGIRHVTFTGRTSGDDRDAAVTAFTTPDGDDPGPTAFVATDAAAEGLNLGRCCSTMINVDLPWNPATLIQRVNRIHRVDSTHDSYLVINMTLTGTLEAGILKLLEAKVDLADAILGETGGRAVTTGRAGRRNFVEEALDSWSES